MNPCPCGYLGESSGRCRCAPPEIARYRARISGPLLDRIDLRVEVPAVRSEELLGEHGAGFDAASAARSAAQRVRAARALQTSSRRQAQLRAERQEIQEFCRLDRACRLLLTQARAKLALSARGMHRVLRVARTIADLETADSERTRGCDAADSIAMRTWRKHAARRAIDTIGPAHLAEALQLRRVGSTESGATG